MNNKLTFVERTDTQWHRSPIILHADSMFYFAEFENVEQLDFFASTVGFTYTAIDWRETERCGIWRDYETSHKITTAPRSFWSLEELPTGAKPIKALSNGSLVTCYYTNDGETITFYRPNPNAKNVYRPMTIEQHIAHRNIYGMY